MAQMMMSGAGNSLAERIFEMKPYSKKSRVSRLRSKVSPDRSSAFRLPSSVSPDRGQAAFTLLELLIVIALIMVLAGLMIPAFFKIQNKAKEKKASIETRIIASAIQAYKLQEHKFPAPDGDLAGGGSDRAYGQGASDGNNGVVMKLLREVDPPVLDPDKLRWSNESVDANVLNPDGNQYTIKLDLNYDGKIDGDAVEYKVE